MEFLAHVQTYPWHALLTKLCCLPSHMNCWVYMDCLTNLNTYLSKCDAPITALYIWWLIKKKQQQQQQQKNRFFSSRYLTVKEKKNGDGLSNNKRQACLWSHLYQAFNFVYAGIYDSHVWIVFILARTTGKSSAESFFFLVFWFNPFHVSVYFIWNSS